MMILLRSCNFVSYTKSGPIRCSKQTLFNVISQTQNYPKFIPWVDASKIVQSISPQENFTQLTISFNRFKQLSYTSHVKMSQDGETWTIRSLCKDEPLKKLESVWEITEKDRKSCDVNYKLDFQFSSPIYQLASSVLKDSMG